MLMILHVNYFYNWFRFKVAIDKSLAGAHFFPDTVYIVRVCMAALYLDVLTD